MNKKELIKMIKRGECQKAEFKESLSLKDEIGETVSAFSNTNNGVILVGVSDFKEIIGVQIGKKTIEGLANFIKQNTDNHVFPKINVEIIDGKKIIVIEVKEESEKPVFFKGNAYKRVGRTNHKLSASEIRKLAKESGEKVYWDEQVCETATLRDIDEEKVKWFLRKAKAERRFNVELETPFKEALEKLNLIKNGKLTNAAILLFGKNSQKFFLQAEIRCARFKGIEPLEFIDMKVFGGDIINQRGDALEFIKEHIKLHAKIVGTERAEKWEYPIEAIREAITNALCHRNYELTSNVQIRIFDDRIEIWGCGTLPKPLTIGDLKKKHESLLRNPLIGKCFFLIKFIEQWGTGTNRIIKECLVHGLPEPLFELVTENLVVTLRKYKVSEKMLKQLNERQRKVINFLKEHGKITNRDFQKLCPTVTRETLRKDLKVMHNKKIIIRKGSKRGVYYELI